MNTFHFYAIFFLTALVAVSAQAKSYSFENCKSDILTEVFTQCPQGEGGSNTLCGSQTTKWGTATTKMTVDSQTQTAQVSLVYTTVDGAVVTTDTTCTLGDDHWMECTSLQAVPDLGHLIVAFNIGGIAQGVYFVDVFADATNVPVGGFQTKMSCDSK